MACKIHGSKRHHSTPKDPGNKDQVAGGSKAILNIIAKVAVVTLLICRMCPLEAIITISLDVHHSLDQLTMSDR